jgi:hypothetical protein
LDLATLHKQATSSVRAAKIQVIPSLREDSARFAEYAFEDRHGRGIRLGRMHREWHTAWTEDPRVLIVAPRDHGKSTNIIARTVWELGRDPNLRIKFVCQADPKARERLAEIRAHITMNPRVREVFPDLVPADGDDENWNKGQLVVRRQFISKDPSLQACGVTASGAGGRADLMVFDDVVDLRNAVTIPALRETVKTNFKAVWINLLEPDGRAWYIATPWHTDDLTHWLLKQGVYRALQYPIGPRFEPVWAEGWPRAALIARHKEIGAREFDRAFRLIALTSDDMTFPSFEQVLEAGRGLRIADIVPSHAPRYSGMDVAGSSRKGWCIFTIARLPDGRRVPVEIRRGAWKGPEAVRQATQVNRQHRPQLFNVENNGVQSMVLDWIREAQKHEHEPDWIPLAGFHTGRQKADPNVGLPSLEVELSSGGWVIPAGEFEGHEPECECGWCEWVREARHHPIYATTDTVMAWWFAREAARGGYGLPDGEARQDDAAPSASAALEDDIGHFDTGLAFGGWRD